MLNQTMQQEILQLRAYIEQQQSMIQVAASTSSSEVVGQDQQLLASLLYERNRVTQLEKDLQNKDQALKSLISEQPGLSVSRDSSSTPSREPSRSRHESMSSEVGRIMASPDNDLMLQNERLKYDLDKSVGERRVLSQQMENWKRQLTQSDSQPSSPGQDDVFDDDSEDFIRMKQEQAYRSVGALQLRVEELTLEVTKLLEERDTLQLRLSNVMRQFERHKDSASRASTACSTPVPWVDNVIEVKELRLKIEELSQLNYSLDVELQKERESRETMQAKLRLHGPARSPQVLPRSSEDRDSPGPVQHI